MLEDIFLLYFILMFKSILILFRTDYVRDVTTQTEKVGQGWETGQVCPGWGQHVSVKFILCFEMRA